MRIAIVYLRILTGGVERVLDKTLSLLDPNHQIAVFTEIHEPGEFSFLDSLVRFKLGNKVPSSATITGQMSQRRRLGILVRQIKKWKPDVMLVCGSKAVRYSNWLASETEVPTVVYFQSFYSIGNIRGAHTEFRNALGKFYRMHLTLSGCDSSDLKNIKLAICVSHAIENAALAKFPNLKTTVIYNGVDHELFFPTYEDENYALSISRFSPDKNLEILPRALGGADYPVTLYGSLINDGEASKMRYFENLKAQRSHNITFEFHNDQSTLVQRLQKCSIFLHPARNEAFGLTALEAMACGKVVVGHKGGGMSECVGEAGHLLGDDEDEWRSTVGELMRSESLRKELGKKAYLHSKQFTWQKTASSLEEALENARAL